ncbi:unnamed protein product [Closterium sp. NIES-65]|nr:unnamed protein product [Closterium sp. NIES-65]
MAAEWPLLAEEEEDEAEVARAWRAVEAVRVTADVAAAARHLMALLRRVQAHGGLCDEGPALDTAIRRYERCWLQLAGRLSDDEMCRLLPPIDVEWVWLCHRLNPVFPDRPDVLPCALYHPPLYSHPSLHRMNLLATAFPSHCLPIPLPSHPTAFPSHCLPIPLPSHPTAFPSHCLPIPLPSHPTAFPSHCLPIPLPSHPTAFPSHCLPIPLPSHPTAFPSHCLPIPLPSHPTAKHEAYGRECEARVGRVVEQAVFDTSECDPSHLPATNHAACSSSSSSSSSSGDGREAAEAATRRVWDRLFPHEPYDLFEPRRAGSSQHGGGVGDADDDGARESTQCGRGNEDRGEAQGGPAGEERGSFGEGPRCCNFGAGARCSLACVEGRRGEGRGAESRGEPAGASEGSLRGSRTAEASREPGAVDLLAGAGVESREAAEGAGEGQHVQYDLRAAVLQQRGLFLEVDRPWMVQTAYLRGSVQRYRMFLCLFKSNPATPLTPTCDIDLIWHAHMMCARAYATDCHHLVGRLIAHHDSLSPTPALAPSALACSPCDLAGPRSPGPRHLEAAHRATALLWERTFAVPFARAGAVPPAHASSLPPAMRMGGAAVGHEQQATAEGAGEQEGSWACNQCRSDTAAGADVERQQQRQHTEQQLRSSKKADADKESVGSGGTGEQGEKVRRMAVAGCVSAGEANAGLGLWQRSTVDVEVTVWTVRGLLLPAPDCLSVSLSALHAAPAFSARTPALPFHPAAPPPRWRHGFSVQAEVASEGLRLSLHAHSPSLLSSLLPWLLPPAPRELGSAVLTWHRLLQHPSLLLHCLLPLAPPGCTPAAYAAATAPLTAASTAATGSSGLVARAAEEGGVERVGGAGGRAEGSVGCPAGQAGLQVGVSLTPATAAPFLLRAVPVCTSDDRGAMLCASLAQHRPQCGEQAGRWVSRTVLDHRGVEAFVMRTRWEAFVMRTRWEAFVMRTSPSPLIHFSLSSPAPHPPPLSDFVCCPAPLLPHSLEPWSRVAEGVWEDHKRPKPGGWSYVPTDATPLPLTAPLHERVGVCRGPVLAQAVPRGGGGVRSGHGNGEKEGGGVGAGGGLVVRYALMGCLPGAAMAELGVRCRVVDGALVQGSLQLELQEEGGHQVALLPGRHLSYTVCGAAAAEEHGFATLVRYTGGPGLARATALLNWRGCVVEVAREESVALALLLCVAIAEALHDMLAAPRCMCFRPMLLPNPDPDTHWQALCLNHGSHAPSSDAARPSRGGRSEERGEESGWAMGEQAERRWWEQRPLAWMPGAASCDFGACGPSFTHG